MTRPDDHRTRYELLHDRRRALRELERLAARLHERPGIDPARLDEIMAGVGLELGGRASQASCAALLRDVRTIYRGLILLARLWTGPTRETAARLQDAG